MSAYKRILVPVDGSSTSMRGLREAVRLARGGKARLWLLHVVDEFYAYANPEMAALTDTVVKALMQGGRRILERAQARARAGGVKAAALMPEVMGGRAADEIIKQARKVRADLIVLGTHGRRGVKRLALGSDAEQVVRRSPVPVLLVRSG